jgi:hypothetical protein
MNASFPFLTINTRHPFAVSVLSIHDHPHESLQAEPGIYGSTPEHASLQQITQQSGCLQ